MASTSEPPRQTNEEEILTIGQIVDTISNLHQNLKSSLQKTNNNENNDIRQARKNVALQKVYNDLNYMEYAFQNLREYEKDVTKPILTLKRNVESIISNDETVPPKVVGVSRINRISKDIGNLNSQIPPAHKFVFTRADAHQDFQKSNGSGTSKVLNLHFSDLFSNSLIYKELKQSFETLTPKMQLCLLCFAVFPENAVVKRRILTYWWVGEDLLDIPVSGNKTTAEDMAFQVLEEFAKRGFIEPVNPKREQIVNSYKMQPFVQSAVIELAKIHNFFSFVPNEDSDADTSTCKRVCMLKSEDGSSGKVPEKGSLNTDQESISNGRTDGSISNPGELQTLFNIIEPFPEMPPDVLGKMAKLNVLCLGRWQKSDSRNSTNQHIEVESTEFLKELKNMSALRLLSLQGISRIDSFPTSGNNFTKYVSPCKLTNLRILDLRACHNLEFLPDWLKYLVNLTHLDITDCFLLNRMPRSLSSLLNLQVLKGFVISDNNESQCSLEDLARLKKLRKLSININKKDFPIDDGLAALKDLNELKTLSVEWGGDNNCNQRKAVLKSETTEESIKQKVGDELTKNKSVSSETIGIGQKEIKKTNKGNIKSLEVREEKKEQRINVEDVDGKQSEIKEVQNVAAEEKTKKSVSSETSGIGQKEIKKTNKGSIKSLEFGEEREKQRNNVVDVDGKQSEIKEVQNVAAEEKITEPVKAKTGATSQEGIVNVKNKVTISEIVEEKKHTDDKVRAEKPKVVEDGKQASNPVQFSRLGSKTRTINTGDKKPGGLTRKETMKKVLGNFGLQLTKENEKIVIPPSLNKLELRCFPEETKPGWLVPGNLKKLTKLCIRGGSITSLGEIKKSKDENWQVKVLHLKYLEGMKMNWSKLQALFPSLEYLEKVKCPEIILCPCDDKGVWLKCEQH